MNLTTISIAILLVILTILGFNLVYYLQKTGQFVFATSAPIAKETAGIVKTIGETGLGAVEGGIEGTVQGAIRGSQRGIGIASKLNHSPDQMIQDARNSIYIGSYLPHRNELKSLPENKRESEIGKDGYCLIGQEGMDGIPRRACIRVGVNDRCMSNKIYPTMEVCINPALRA